MLERLLCRPLLRRKSGVKPPHSKVNQRLKLLHHRRAAAGCATSGIG